MGSHRSVLYGGLISTATPEEHIRLFSDVFGMAVVGTTRLDAAAASALFDAPLSGAELVVLQTPGVESGVVLVSFTPTSAETVRSYETRVDRDALKVIDFYAPDYEDAIAHARGLGYEVVEAEAEYELAAGTFREAHLWAPDNVVTAFLGGPAEFFADFAQVGDRRTSEVQSISAPVSDGAPVVEFYREVLGWDVVFEYAIDDPSFSALVGIEEPLRLRSRNVGPSTREPYLGLIDYGLPADVGGSLLGRSVAPRRGLLGAVVLVGDLGAVVAAAGGAAGPVQALDPVAFVGPRACVLTPPHGVPHLVLERAGLTA
ncbi:hypothetical protein [Nocardioides ochotonae]|uniref:hypothetical protein n=1 Tax=Nocardioides ochotonae TaxID=2685869 RepID=UPI00140E0E2D|nr:hypothetical protein [Nocardioides ochotonae]